MTCFPNLGHPELEFPGFWLRLAGLPLSHLPAISAAYCRSRCVGYTYLKLAQNLLDITATCASLYIRFACLFMTFSFSSYGMF